jgi:hypothetical protein
MFLVIRDGESYAEVADVLNGYDIALDAELFL